MWNKTFDSSTAWIHMNGFKKRSNANAYYSPGVDRFFAVDSFDPYTAFEVAQILSGKMPGISICVLSVDDAWFENNNCHEYTLQDKSFLSPGNSVLYNRQIPMIRKMPPKSVIQSSAMPTDYTNPSVNFDNFMKFKEYAQFVIQVWHTAKLAEMYFNTQPMESYLQDYFGQSTPEGFITTVDSINGKLKTGITKEIKKVLYNSSSPDEALDAIADIWADNSTHMGSYWRDFFYKILEVEMPAKVVAAGTNIDGYSGYIL